MSSKTQKGAVADKSTTNNLGQLDDVLRQTFAEYFQGATELHVKVEQSGKVSLTDHGMQQLRNFIGSKELGFGVRMTLEGQNGEESTRFIQFIRDLVCQELQRRMSK